MEQHSIAEGLDTFVTRGTGLGLVVRTTSGESWMTPHEARQMLRHPGTSGDLRAAIWQAAILAAQLGVPDSESSAVLALWLAVPWSRRAISLITQHFPIAHEDLESEFSVTFLERIQSVDPDDPGAGLCLLKAAAQAAWELARAGRCEVTVPDPSVLDRLAPVAECDWELEYVPHGEPDHLSASLRFVVSRERAEGERLGLIAHELGLTNIVLRAKRPAEGQPAGTLLIRPAGVSQ